MVHVLATAHSSLFPRVAAVRPLVAEPNADGEAQVGAAPCRARSAMLCVLCARRRPAPTGRRWGRGCGGAQPAASLFDPRVACCALLSALRSLLLALPTGLPVGLQPGEQRGHRHGALPR